MHWFVNIQILIISRFRPIVANCKSESRYISWKICINHYYKYLNIKFYVGNSKHFELQHERYLWQFQPFWRSIVIYQSVMHQEMKIMSINNKWEMEHTDPLLINNTNLNTKTWKIFHFAQALCKILYVLNF